MPSPKPGVTYICPNCHQPVDPRKPNAMLSAATQEWQHKDCWRATTPIVQPEAPSKNPQRGSPA